MQVLLALIDADGAVATREFLLERCWAGMHVGEDSLNRAISELRRTLRVVDPSFGVATISGTGYRLTGLPCRDDETDPQPPASLAISPASDESLHVARQPRSRRWLISGMAAAVAVSGAGGAWWWPRRTPLEQRARTLADRGDLVRRDDMPDAAQQGIAFYREALKLTPDDAAIWGKLSLALAAVAEYGEPSQTASAVAATEQAATRAIALRPGQPDARVALAVLVPDFGVWLTTEQRLRAILADAPGNVAAQAALAMLLVEVGRLREAALIVERLLEEEPLSPEFNYRQVYLFWAQGRQRAADRVADRALQLWPEHPAVWLARFWTFALSGRATAASAMIKSSARPPFPGPMLTLLRVSCIALASRDPADVAAAVIANTAAARRSQFGVVNGALVLPVLGAIDAAFQILRGYLVREGPLIGALRRPAGQPAVNQQNRRKTQMLWMPSGAALRSDPRFLVLCRDAGLYGYWESSGHWPDEFRAARLAT